MTLLDRDRVMWWVKARNQDHVICQKITALQVHVSITGTYKAHHLLYHPSPSQVSPWLESRFNYFQPRGAQGAHSQLHTYIAHNQTPFN